MIDAIIEDEKQKQEQYYIPMLEESYYDIYYTLSKALRSK